VATIYMLCGKVGCGKSTHAMRLKAQTGAMVLSCDEMMLSIFDEYMGDDFRQAYDKCTGYLYKLAEELISIGVDVVLDCGFWARQQRKTVRDAFVEKGIATKLCYVKADEATITRRLTKRNEDIDAGLVKAYHVDENMRALFDARFEEPSADEVDEYIDGSACIKNM
jgi:predicted kinase